MTHFEDLSAYTYSRDETPLRALNVGWLDAAHSFPTAEPDDRLLDALWEYCSIIVLATRGLHACELCEQPSNTFSRQGRKLLLGSGEIRVFGSGAEVFAAPNLIYHYVQEHQYRPPAEFVRALEGGPRPGSGEYVHLLDGLALPWRDNAALSGEPAQFRFVLTENGIEKVDVKDRERG